jgi:hypothetical protein
VPPDLGDRRTNPAVDATVASPAYQQILAVLTAAAGPLRVKRSAATPVAGVPKSPQLAYPA